VSLGSGLPRPGVHQQVLKREESSSSIITSIDIALNGGSSTKTLFHESIIRKCVCTFQAVIKDISGCEDLDDLLADLSQAPGPLTVSAVVHPF